MNFNEKIVTDVISYFRKNLGIDITQDEALLYLSHLSDLIKIATDIFIHDELEDLWGVDLPRSFEEAEGSRAESPDSDAC